MVKFKYILYMGFRANLNFRKFKVALNPTYIIYLNFVNSILLTKFFNKKKFYRAVFEILSLKAEIKGVFSIHSVAMVTYFVMKIIPTCSPVIGLFFDTITVASIDKE